MQVKALVFVDSYLERLDCLSKVWYSLTRSRKLVSIKSLREIIGTPSCPSDHHLKGVMTPARMRQPVLLLLGSRIR
jgi:hypothetical protein